MLLFPVLSRAVNVTWDGDSDANADGLWDAGVNWSTNAIPGAADNARLLDVTSGTREVTIADGSPQTINQLTITQTTAGAVNVLNVNDNLTISGTGTSYAPFVMTATAGQASIVTNIAAGKALLVTNTADAYTANHAGTVNVGEGASFIVKNTAAASDKFASAVFSGPVTLAANARFGVENGSEGNNKQAALTIAGTVEVGEGATLISASSESAASNKHATITLNGVTTVMAGGTVRASTGNAGSIGVGVLNVNNDFELAGDIVVRGGGGTINLATGTTSQWTSGSTILVQANNGSGVMQLNNDGILEMDGAALTMDFASTALNIGVRRFNNTGEWTLTNGSTFSFTASGLKEIGNEGFKTGAENLNSGTLRVESGSRVEFMSLLNTGVMSAGSSNEGESDALVRLGNTVGGTNFTGFRTVVLNNGYATGNATLDVLGDVWLGRTNSISGTFTSLENGTALTQLGSSTSADASTGNVINIGDGSTHITLTVANKGARVTNATANTINLKKNATLTLKSVEAATEGDVMFTNRGTFEHAGRLVLETNAANTSNRTFAHGSDSTYRIKGANAVIEAAGGAHTAGLISFTSSGLITGSSSYDKLTYINSTGSGTFATLGLTMTGGEITAGNGTNGSGASSIGTLEFVNTNITLTGATKLSFDIGGLGNDEAPVDGDFNPVLTFDRIVLGASKTFALGTGAVLDIWITNGFYTETAQTYTLIDTGLGGEGSVTGSFATLLFQGQALDADQYTVNISNGQMSITLAAGLGTPVPEPSTFALMAALATAGVAAGARRRRAA